MSLDLWVNGANYALFSVLILIEVGTLVKLTKEGEHKQCIQILVLYIISNVAMIVNIFLNTKIENHESQKDSNEYFWFITAGSRLQFTKFARMWLIGNFAMSTTTQQES